MKLHIFAKFSMVNLLMDPVFEIMFHLKISDIFKRDQHHFEKELFIDKLWARW